MDRKRSVVPPTGEPANAGSGSRQAPTHKQPKWPKGHVPSLAELDRLYGNQQPAKPKKELWAKPDPQAYLDALSEHRKNHALARSWVQQGAKSSNPQMRNACEWILGGGKVKLYSLTPTHDGTRRAQRHGDRHRGACFSANHDILSTDPGDYDFDTNSMRNITMSAGGMLVGNKLLVQNTGRREGFMSTVLHEMIHVSDHQGQASRSPEGLRNYYATEFRAWYHTPEMQGKIGSASKPGGGKWRTERQRMVAEHLFSKYKILRAAWDADVSETGFRQFVYTFDMHNAEGCGPNLLLSTRIERFIQALKTGDVPQIQQAIAALQPDETAYIKRNYAAYGRWIDRLPHQAQAVVYTAFGMTIDPIQPGSPANE